MTPPARPELKPAMALALESCEHDIEIAMQILERARYRAEAVRIALANYCSAQEAA